MKVLFLDIDGVLNSTYTFSRRHATWLESGNPVKEVEFSFPMGHLDEYLIPNLNIIIEQTDCKIVISSSWRLAHSPQQISEWLEKKGFKYPSVIIGRTANLPLTGDEDRRGKEIIHWLHLNKDIEKYCIVDDDSIDILNLHPNNFVHTNGNEGLTLEKANEIIAKLNNP